MAIVSCGICRHYLGKKCWQLAPPTPKVSTDKWANQCSHFALRPRRKGGDLKNGNRRKKISVAVPHDPVNQSDYNTAIDLFAPGYGRRIEGAGHDGKSG